MEEYTIYCTEEQTRKALELGAPIEVKTIKETPKDWQGKAFFTGMGTCAKFPTAEQMIGWLEEQEGIISFDINKWDNGWGYNVDITSRDKYLCKIHCSSRKEATLAAIDAALEYLSEKLYMI